MTECDEIIIFMDNKIMKLSTKNAISIATKKTNTIATNVTSAVSIYFHSKKVRYCYILHIFLLEIILLLIMIIICYYYAKQKDII